MSTEGCSSSESGWTMYIASPMQEDEKENEDDHADFGSVNDKKTRHVYHQRYHNDIAEDHDMDTDDSMASDASSGPTHSHHSTEYSRREDSKDESRLKKDKKKQYSSHHQQNNNNNKSKKDQKRSREKSGRKK